MDKNKGFFARHSKSSAAIVSLAIHAVLVVVALSFVAISVVKKSTVDFEVKQVKRPQMKIRKLQVPVKQSTPQPKLRKQIVAKPKINRILPEIKMPEMVGVTGGTGGAGNGLGGAGSLGFSMPEINFFGVKSKTEKIMLILDANRDMSADRLGGAYGYQVIKKECLHLLEGLPPTAVFNIVVYDGDKSQQLFAQMESANADNTQKAREWLMPLNQVIGAKTKYGINTLGKGGHRVEGDYPFGKFKDKPYYPRGWNMPVMLAMQEQADTVFLLTSGWGSFLYFNEDPKEFQRKWYETADGKLYKERAHKARQLLDEENKKRKAAGEPPSSVNRNSDRALVRTYFKGTHEPPNPPHVDLGVRDFAEAFGDAYKAFASNAPKLGIQKKNRHKFSLNVIFFTSKDDKDAGTNDNQFKQLANALNGELSVVHGLDAIKSYVSASSLKE